MAATEPSHLPVIDLQLLDEAAQVGALRRALLGGNGAFYVVGHGVAPALVDEVFRRVGRFMEQPLARKLRVELDDESELWQGAGYYTFGKSEGRLLRRASVERRRANGELIDAAAQRAINESNPERAVDLESKIYRVDPDFGSTLTASNGDSQSNCWINWKIMGQPCEFQVSQWATPPPTPPSGA